MDKIYTQLEMKTAEEIFMEVQDIECPNVNNLTLPEDWQLKAMKVYANQKLDEAAGAVVMTYHCGHTKNNIPTKYHQSGADNIQINKKSILSLKDQI